MALLPGEAPGMGKIPLTPPQKPVLQQETYPEGGQHVSNAADKSKLDDIRWTP